MRGERTSRLVRTAAFVLGLGVLGIFALLPSATATPQPTARAAPAPDLSTVPKIRSYLRLLGVDPRGVVVQRGERNYAGPNCPGPSWNCTTSLKVVQISTGALDGGDDDDNENRFVCKRNSGSGSVTQQPAPPNQSCTIVQNNPNSNNSATCDIETYGSEGTITQVCFITQTGKRNTASARQVARMSASGTEQDVVQTISVKQTSSGNQGNTLDTAQSVFLNSGPDASSEAVKQDVHQLNCVNQDAAGSGPNVARSGQSQVLLARKHGADLEPELVDIAQNDELVPAVCTGPAVPFPPFPTIGTHDPTDCAVAGSSPPKESANACTRTYQESDTGRNTIELGQLDSLFAEVKNSTGGLDVQQGNTAPGETGTDATLDQKSGGVSKITFGGLTSQVTSINGAEDIGFFAVDQTDTGPRCCASGHQEANTGNTFDIDGRLFQRVIVDGETDVDNLPGNGFVIQDGATYGDCVTTGNCTVDLAASNNADSDTADCSGTSCHEEVDCFAVAGKGEFGDCTDEPDVITVTRRPR